MSLLATPVRRPGLALTACLVIGGMVLPHLAPAVCALVNPEMTAAGVDDTSVAISAAASHSCDFAECSHAPAAPTTVIQPAPVRVWLTEAVDLGEPDARWGEVGPPLTPPPQA